jgi:hypothetical protein
MWQVDQFQIRFLSIWWHSNDLMNNMHSVIQPSSQMVEWQCSSCCHYRHGIVIAGALCAAAWPPQQLPCVMPIPIVCLLVGVYVVHNFPSPVWQTWWLAVCISTWTASFLDFEYCVCVCFMHFLYGLLAFLCEIRCFCKTRDVYGGICNWSDRPHLCW